MKNNRCLIPRYYTGTEPDGTRRYYVTFTLKTETFPSLFLGKTGTVIDNYEMTDQRCQTDLRNGNKIVHMFVNNNYFADIITDTFGNSGTIYLDDICSKTSSSTITFVADEDVDFNRAEMSISVCHFPWWN